MNEPIQQALFDQEVTDDKPGKVYVVKTDTNDYLSFPGSTTWINGTPYAVGHDIEGNQRMESLTAAFSDEQ